MSTATTCRDPGRSQKKQRTCSCSETTKRTMRQLNPNLNPNTFESHPIAATKQATAPLAQAVAVAHHPPNMTTADLQKTHFLIEMTANSNFMLSIKFPTFVMPMRWLKAISLKNSKIVGGDPGLAGEAHISPRLFMQLSDDLYFVWASFKYVLELPP